VNRTHLPKEVYQTEHVGTTKSQRVIVWRVKLSLNMCEGIRDRSTLWLPYPW